MSGISDSSRHYLSHYRQECSTDPGSVDGYFTSLLQRDGNLLGPPVSMIDSQFPGSDHLPVQIISIESAWVLSSRCKTL